MAIGDILKKGKERKGFDLMNLCFEQDSIKGGLRFWRQSFQMVILPALLGFGVSMSLAKCNFQDLHHWKLLAGI